MSTQRLVSFVVDSIDTSKHGNERVVAQTHGHGRAHAIVGFDRVLSVKVREKRHAACAPGGAVRGRA